MRSSLVKLALATQKLNTELEKVGLPHDVLGRQFILEFEDGGGPLSFPTIIAGTITGIELSCDGSLWMSTSANLNNWRGTHIFPVRLWYRSGGNEWRVGFITPQNTEISYAVKGDIEFL
ncbi:MAG: hypothetical protein WCT19_02760 [Candidatus Paceibacterota bacterium]|jgi:hypothetical protein